MTDLVFRVEDEGVARLRSFKLAEFMVRNGESVGRSVRLYESTNGDTYELEYSHQRYKDWDARFIVNDETVCSFLFPKSWLTPRFSLEINKAREHLIEDERVFISEFYEFIEDYREEE